MFSTPHCMVPMEFGHSLLAAMVSKQDIQRFFEDGEIPTLLRFLHSDE